VYNSAQSISLKLLSRLDTVSASQILALIAQASQIHGSMKGQEERDMLFARLFGITSLTRSGILFRSTPLSTSSLPACTMQNFKDAMTMLLALPSQKSFLREPSYWTFILALRALNASEVEWKDEALTWVTEVFAEDKAWSPEKVGVALTMQGLGVEKDWKILLAPTFKNGDILSSGSLSNLAKILRVMLDLPTSNFPANRLHQPRT
jgi:DNA polymerase phi